MTAPFGRTRFAALVTFVASATCTAPTLSAQSAQRSSIEGVVTDQQGAVIVSATVRLSGDRVLGGERSVVSDDAGRYRFAGLLPGTYAVTASAYWSLAPVTGSPRACSGAM